MLTLHEYVDKNIGKKVRDGQCVALARDYAEACYGIPHTGSVEGAIDIWKTRHSNQKIRQYFDVVEGRPEAGDWVFFNPTSTNPTSTNKYGHIAVVLEDRGDGFNVFESDGFNPNAGSKKGFWTWSRYAGALRPKTA
jgi:hypothetical protein